MSIRNFVLSLTPSIERKMVNKDIARLRSELTTATIPSYEKASAFLKDWDFKDSYNTELEMIFKKYVNTRFKGNFITITYELMKRTLENLNVIEKQINSEFGNDIIRSALTYSRAQVLQMVEAFSFTNKYARLMLIQVMSTETNVVAKRNQDRTSLNNAQRKWLLDNRQVFIKLLLAIDKTPRELEKLLKSIPDVSIDTETEGLEAVVGASKLDPLQLGIAVRKLNPIYHIRMNWEDWMYHRLEVAKEEHQTVEYQLMDLKNQQEGRNDPRLDKAIEYTEDRLTKLNYKIAKMEED
jgi:hypothetical protein